MAMYQNMLVVIDPNQDDQPALRRAVYLHQRIGGKIKAFLPIYDFSYRVSTTVRNVILSGYFDSIGIYQAVSDRQQKLVQQWLDILGIDKRTADAPFHSLSWGQQRLALIVRALVKHPTLLILDEPLQGLDPLNRQLIRRFVDVLISEGETQLLFVSHHAEDAPACITHRLEFVPDGGLYRYVLTKIY